MSWPFTDQMIFTSIGPELLSLGFSMSWAQGRFPFMLVSMASHRHLVSPCQRLTRHAFVIYL